MKQQQSSPWRKYDQIQSITLLSEQVHYCCGRQPTSLELVLGNYEYLQSGIDYGKALCINSNWWSSIQAWDTVTVSRTKDTFMVPGPPKHLEHSQSSNLVGRIYRRQRRTSNRIKQHLFLPGLLIHPKMSNACPPLLFLLQPPLAQTPIKPIVLCARTQLLFSIYKWHRINLLHTAWETSRRASRSLSPCTQPIGCTPASLPP
jgi:hypothetical protein